MNVKISVVLGGKGKGKEEGGSMREEEIQCLLLSCCPLWVSGEEEGVSERYKGGGGSEWRVEGRRLGEGIGL